MVGQGLSGFFSEGFNIFDFFVVALAIVELVMVSRSGGGGSLSALRYCCHIVANSMTSAQVLTIQGLVLPFLHCLILMPVNLMVIRFCVMNVSSTRQSHHAAFACEAHLH